MGSEVVVTLVSIDPDASWLCNCAIICCERGSGGPLETCCCSGTQQLLITAPPLTRLPGIEKRWVVLSNLGNNVASCRSFCIAVVGPTAFPPIPDVALLPGIANF